MEQANVLMNRGVFDTEADPELEAKVVETVEDGERIARLAGTIHRGRDINSLDSFIRSRFLCFSTRDVVDCMPWDDVTYQQWLERLPTIREQLAHQNQSGNVILHIKKVMFVNSTMTKLVAEYIWRHLEITAFTMDHDAGLFGTRALSIAHALRNHLSLKLMTFDNTDATVEFTSALGLVAMDAQNLETVSLRETEIKDTGAIFWGIALSKGAPKLRYLDLAGGGIGYRGATALALGLRSHKALRILDLSNNRISRTGCMKLGEALVENPVLEELNLTSNAIGSRGASALAAFLSHPNARLKVLVLEKNDIGPNGGKSLAVGLSLNKTLRKLALSHNDMGDEGTGGFGEALTRNSTLEILELDDNDMTDIGLAALSVGLKANTTLLTLRLASQVIRDAGAEALARSLAENTTMQTLHLEQNGISDFGARALASMLRTNVTLTELRLNDNEIGNVGGIELGRILADKENRKLQVLDLTNNPISSDISKKWFAAAESRVVTNSTQRLDIVAEGTAMARGNLREFGVVVIRSRTGMSTLFLMVTTLILSWFDFISDIIVIKNEYAKVVTDAPGGSIIYAVLTTLFVVLPFTYILIFFSLPADESDATLPVNRMGAEDWQAEEVRRHLQKLRKSRCTKDRAILTFLNIFQARLSYELYLSWRDGLSTLAYTSIRLVEVVFESLPQSLIQLHILLSTSSLQKIAVLGFLDPADTSTLVLLISLGLSVMTLSRTISDLFEKKYVVSWKRNAFANEELAMLLGLFLVFLYHFFHYLMRAFTIVIVCHIFHPVICAVIFAIGVVLRMALGAWSDRRRMFAVVSYFVGSASWDARFEARMAHVLETVEMLVAIVPLWIPLETITMVISDPNYKYIFQANWLGLVALAKPLSLTLILVGCWILSSIFYLTFVERIHAYSDVEVTVIDAEKATTLAGRAFQENLQAIRKRRREKLAGGGGVAKYGELMNHVGPEEGGHLSLKRGIFSKLWS
jgi:Ran GTPase-activating protein (RanGAP) involved in mRNA processing and transport